MCQIGYDQLMFELSFDPTLYLKKRSLEDIKNAIENREITAFLVERQGNIIKAMKYTNFLEDEHEFLKEKWFASLDNGIDGKFMEFFNSFSIYDLPALWSKAESR